MKQELIIIGIVAKKKLFEIFVCMLLIGTCFVGTLDTVSADDLVDGDYTYTVNNGAAIITDYTGAGGTIMIPSTLGGYPTVTIGDSAFTYCQTLISVAIPNSVTTIEQGAFYHTSLTSVTIGNSVITINSSAFGHCSSLTSVTIGSNVTIIGAKAFSFCASLTSIIIPSSVTTIGYAVFSYCTNLTSITFLGLVAPTTVDLGWITNTSVEIRGHAYAGSNFAAPGGVWNGLTMGTVINDENEPPADDNELPVADFTWAPLNPKTNQEITFNASISSDPDGSLNSYEWDWNNDSAYEESHHIPTATHSWAQAGNYPVTVRVSDNNGSTSTKTIIISVSSGTPGFELVFVLCAIATVLFLLRKKRNI